MEQQKTEQNKVRATLVILRHGETDYNVQKLMTGQRDIPLNDTGIAQAKEAGRVLAGFSFDKVYASHLSRAFNTAALALEHSGNHAHLQKADGSWRVEQRPEIAEIDAGDFTGRNHKSDPEVVAWKRDFYKPVPGGESGAMALDRVQRFYETDVLPRLKQGENVLIAAHSGIVRTFDIVLGFVDIPEGGSHKSMRRIENAAPLVVEFEDGIVVSSYHLENPHAKNAANGNAPVKQSKTGVKFGG